MSHPITEQASIVFSPSGKRGKVPLGMSVLEAARFLGVDLDSVCGGRGICGRCQVEPTFGAFAKYGLDVSHDAISEFSDVESRYASVRTLAPGRRLGCSCTIQGDLIVEVPASSQVHKQVLTKGSDEIDIILKPDFRLWCVDVAEPDLHEPTGDWERFIYALQHSGETRSVQLTLPILQELPRLLKAGNRRITVALHDSGILIGAWPGYKEVVYGAAIDVGSTTASIQIVSFMTGAVVIVGGFMNPQIRFGEDLMSRVSYAMMNADGSAMLSASIQNALNAEILQLAQQANIDPKDIIELVLVGNPIMHHLWNGLDAIPLGQAPFAMSSSGALLLKAQEIQISAINRHAVVYSLPLIAGHVGADAAAVALTQRPWEGFETVLIVDVGTNAEIILGHQNRVYACSSPTGPALEGAQISCGQRATPGAIERVRIDRDSLAVRFQVIGCPLWSDEDGFAEALADIGQITGICGSGVIEAIAELYRVGIILQDGSIPLEMQQRTNRVVVSEDSGRTADFILYTNDQTHDLQPIKITQADIRAIQLAKAALYAGTQLLMEYAQTQTVDRIVLAGAFGSHIDPVYALILGLLPDCHPKIVTTARNAAGTGARIALLNTDTRLEIEQETPNIQKIETALAPRFQELFVAAMDIPNRTHPFSQLRNAIPDLPPLRQTHINPSRRRSVRSRVQASQPSISSLL